MKTLIFIIILIIFIVISVFLLFYDSLKSEVPNECPYTILPYKEDIEVDLNAQLQFTINIVNKLRQPVEGKIDFPVGMNLRREQKLYYGDSTLFSFFNLHIINLCNSWNNRYEDSLSYIQAKLSFANFLDSYIVQGKKEKYEKSLLRDQLLKEISKIRRIINKEYIVDDIFRDNVLNKLEGYEALIVPIDLTNLSDTEFWIIEDLEVEIYNLSNSLK